MAEISREALRQLAAKGYEEAEQFVMDVGKYFRSECAYETIGFPTEDNLKERVKKENRIHKDAKHLQYLSARENTKPVLPGIERLSRDEVIRCVVAFAETYYRIDKTGSFEKE